MLWEASPKSDLAADEESGEISKLLHILFPNKPPGYWVSHTKAQRSHVHFWKLVGGSTCAPLKLCFRVWSIAVLEKALILTVLLWQALFGHDALWRRA